jgi:hypothetical protein
MIPNRVKDMSGKIYNDLTVISYAYTKKDGAYWNCTCKCGNSTITRGSSIRRNHTKSCGCHVTRFGVAAMKEARKLKDPRIAARSYFKSYIYRATIRDKRIFTLTFEEFYHISQQNCHYCNRTPKQQHNHHAHTFLYNGIDRKDNTIGYTLENSLPCCKYCNQAKSDLTYEQFKNLICNIYSNWASI